MSQTITVYCDPNTRIRPVDYVSRVINDANVLCYISKISHRLAHRTYVLQFSLSFLQNSFLISW